MGFLSSFRKPSADDPPPTESWPLFAFGKLPVYKDFISVGLTDDASREFRDWLSNGFTRHWSTRDAFRSAEIPPHAFLLRLPESRRMAAGVLWGSTDQGGLRKFPFALFTILPAAKQSASVLTALDYLPVFESRAREIRRKYDAGATLAAVYQDLRGSRIEIPVRPQKQIRLRLSDALARSRVGALARELFGNDAETQWAALLTGLDGAARRPTAGAGAFRFPLADGTSPLDQMKLWAFRLAQASPSGAVPAGVLYRTEGEAHRGVLFFRDARVEDILLLHPEAIPTDFVEEIPPVLAPAAPKEPALPPEAVPEPAPEASRETAVPAVVEEFLTLGAAAVPASTTPASAVPEASPVPEAPTVPASPAAQQPLVETEPPAAAEAPAVPETPSTPGPPPAPEPPAAPDPLVFSEAPVVPTPAAPADGSTAMAPAPPAAGAEPAGWALPLASLLDA